MIRHLESGSVVDEFLVPDLERKKGPNPKRVVFRATLVLINNTADNLGIQ